MKKRLFAIAITIVMILSASALSGCGSSSDTPAETTSAFVETTVAVKESSSVAETTTEETTTDVDSTDPTQDTTKADTKKKSDNSNGSTNKNTSSNSNGSSKSKNVAVTSVSLSKGSMTITEGSSQSFEVYIDPASATDRQYNVVTNNGNATVSCNGSIVTVYAQSKGNCEITVSSTNGKSATCHVTINAKSSSNGSSGNKSNNNSGGSSNNNSNKNNQTITDDTLLTHSQLCSEAIVGRLIDKVNSIYQQKGMTYNSSLNKNNSGWLLSGTNYYPGDYIYSTNSFIEKELAGYEEEVDALVNYDGNSYSDFQFRCYYEKQSNGEYYFYFCYC